MKTQFVWYYFSQGAHVQINARNDDDVDEDTIIDKVKKSSGANYSIHKEKAQAFIPQGKIVSRGNLVVIEIHFGPRVYPMGSIVIALVRPLVRPSVRPSLNISESAH